MSRKVLENYCTYCRMPLFMYMNTKYAEARACPTCYKELEKAHNEITSWFLQAVELSEQGYAVNLLTGEIKKDDT